ncbi:O-antigen ligase family protein [Flavobacterium luteum]|uniref:O-antigen ligase-related domain-containing protein n=1 Tax=Flavobacterium luteum TaxID=2026654 RepID=A0A7J5AHL8_9FLAO|nr:O-antigen ligase family protein [Flavobacterium luteum]KAB1157056.1 hypothetical protein F6464_06850 [Flavobacterium luteum]
MKIDLNKLFLIFLPFTQALTINIFFPLKISEIFLVILLLFYVNKKTISGRSIWFLNQNTIVMLFGFIVTLSFIVNIYWNYDYSPKRIPFRINRIGDSFIRLCYFYICLVSYYLSFKIFTKNIKYLDKWIIGAIIVACYGWYLFLSSALHMPYLKLPGMDDKPQNLNGLIRCGTFAEGNYFGAFLILSAAIAFYLNKPKKAWFLLVTVIITLSTVSLISSFVLIVFYYRKIFLKTSFMIKFCPIIFIFLLLFIQTDYYKMNIYGKLFDPVNKVTRANYSKVERTITAQAAFYSGLDNPIIGVGPANYGLHYDKYNEYKRIVKVRSPYFNHAMKRVNDRAIANNVYLEIWSEYGIFGFILFILFLGLTLLKSIKLKEDAITGGIISLIISFNAFPSFIMLFVWVFLSIPLALVWNKRQSIINPAN